MVVADKVRSLDDIQNTLNSLDRLAQPPSKDELFERKRKEFYGYLTEGVILLTGPAKQGKTMMLVAIARNLRDMYGKHPILDFRPKEPFGEYSYMDPDLFARELSKVGKLAGKEDVAAAAEEVRVKMGIKFDNATLGWDEGYRYLEPRRNADNRVLVYGYYLQQYAHYHSTVIVCTPRLDQVDAKRCLNQVTVELTCNSNIRVTPNGVIGPRDPAEWRVFAKGIDRFFLKPVRHSIPILKYCDDYDSWAPLAIREHMLKKMIVEDGESEGRGEKIGG